jgi:hypothetical protein
LIFWYSTRQASINGNGKVAPAPLRSILCPAIEFPNGMKMPVKNADNNNITKPARTAKFCVLTHFADIDYRSSQEEEAFMASPHDLRILYSNMKERYGGQSRGS